VLLQAFTACRNRSPWIRVGTSVNRRQWTCLTFAGALCGLTLVVLVHQPMRVQRCAIQAVGGPSLACEDRRAWDWPDAADMGAGAAFGALAVAGLVLPFVDRH
jgi:hypothetical protein